MMLKNRSFGKTAIRMVGFGLLFILIVMGIALGVMLLWNWLMPKLFGLSQVNFFEALGILILSKVLFGSLGSDHGEKKKKETSYPMSLTKEEDEFESWWEEEGLKQFQLYQEKKNTEV